METVAKEVNVKHFLAFLLPALFILGTLHYVPGLVPEPDSPLPTPTTISPLPTPTAIPPTPVLFPTAVAPFYRRLQPTRLPTASSPKWPSKPGVLTESE